MAETRDQTRLEVDDPQFCKECGAKMEVSSWGGTDPDGVPVVWMYDEWEWVRVEECHECWWQEQKKRLRHVCEQRYGGRLPEALAR